MDQAFFAQTVAVSLIHKGPLLGCDRDPETLALGNIAWLTGKTISTTRAFMCFMIAHTEHLKY
ncbi:hypothetical protein LZZ85_07565 [Terrimonas sp. NA20]|uniref:Uncharacterized protein n=1 Tax=Terrimonas ginsenosidimutans TaxID=2908004 RepID=A0ABS9KP76_9BACT|nr:hypothetical protein [Terrimonas ginsenosidimutans]MCG2614133.1 hypothetical protein [Terrimonas ginsenosidimutans]